MVRYEIIIYWSNEDGAFIAEVPELPGAPRTAPHTWMPCGTSRLSSQSGLRLPESWDAPFPNPGDAWSSRKGAPSRHSGGHVLRSIQIRVQPGEQSGYVAIA